MENSNLYEDSYRDEFYRCTYNLYNKGTISTNVGTRYGTNGKLDLYINSKIQYGIEFLRNGIEIMDHINRFDINGRYSKIPMKEKALVDFYFCSKETMNFTSYQKKLENKFKNNFSKYLISSLPYYHVIFYCNFKKVTILNTFGTVLDHEYKINKKRKQTSS